MDKLLYVMMMERGKSFNKINKAMVEKHVDHLRKLDEMGKLELCGPLDGLPGVVGMVVLKAESFQEADELCKQEPFVMEGFVEYKLSTLKVADQENNFLI